MISFSELLVVHTRLDAMFEKHQFALLHFDFPDALEQLKQYEAVLYVHMSDEEEILLPLYAERVAIEKGGAVKLFMDEHEKMRQHVLLFKQTVEKLQTDPDPEKTLLMLLDRESFYKRLCSHHDLRESGILYPALDNITEMDERSEILGRLAVS
jgi:iron-sulfur cluster repair protein YtfE (RIC family)